MNFPEHLAALRRHKGLTQQQLADRVGVHVVQLRRYEAGTSQPTLDVIRNMAVALGISADALLFAPDERGPRLFVRSLLIKMFSYQGLTLARIECAAFGESETDPCGR